MAKSYICVFDCETIPDANLIRKIYGIDGSDEDVSVQAMALQKEASGSEFLPVMFHRVVAISAVMADEYGKFLKVSTMEGKDEREIIAKFLKFINDYNPRLVSFNGRGFDLPMLMVRAMRYNLNAAAYYESENKELNKNKWENYRARYSPKFHLDLLDFISDFGSVRGLKLDTLCASLNLPGKYDVHGDQVLELYYAGELDKINEYCESDVLNTYWLFLKFELLQANILQDDYINHLNVMSEFLAKNCAHRGYTEVFCAAISDELARLSGKLDYEIKIQKEDDEEFDDFSDLDGVKDTPEQLNERLARQGLDGFLKKASEVASATKKDKSFAEEKLPEINLDEE